MKRGRVVHLTTTAMSLDWLLGPQLSAFTDAGYEVVAMSAPGPHVAAIEASGIDHVAIPALTRSLAPGSDLRALRQLVQAFRRIGPDIVHTHNPKPGILGRIAARRVGVPVVINTVHGLYATPDDDWLRRGAVYGLERLAIGFSDAELVQNIEDLDQLRKLGVPDEKLTLLGNGVDLARFDPDSVRVDARSRVRAELGVDESTMLIGAVGRLVWEKGYREVFAAAERLEDHNCRFVVVGPDEPGKSGAIMSEARAAAERVGVVFTGPRLDMPEIYRALDVYVLASYREGFPRSAMEASAMGLPVVASDVRGCRQVVVDGVTGALFPAGDADSLTGILAMLEADPEIRRGWGEAARSRARREFDDRRVIATTLRTYEWLLAGGAAATRSRALSGRALSSSALS